MNMHTGVLGAVLSAATATATATAGEPAGLLRVELRTPGGALPVVVDTGDAAGGAVVGGGERVAFAWRRDGARRVALFDAYGSSLVFEPGMASGVYRTPRRDGVFEVPFTARPASHEQDRFDAAPDLAGESDTRGAGFDGRWRVRFAGSSDDAVGVFEVEPGSGEATGTFLTTTGDYRYLSGRADGRRLRLSAFDGAHAFLFEARLGEDGSVVGDFWSGTWHHEAWTAVRDEAASLPDAFGLTKPAAERLEPGVLAALTFKPGTGGTGRATLASALPHGTPRLLYIFGTWCPNCSDATAFIGSLARAYGKDGLRVAGLAFEHAWDDAPRRVAAYAEHHGVGWPVLIGGLSRKDEASRAVPFLDGVRAFPTAVFIDRDGRIRAVYQGFSGPATGEAHAAMARRWRETIEAMLEE